MERYWEIAQVIESMLVILLLSIVFGRFVKPFLKNKRSCKAAGAGFFLTVLALYLIPYEMLGMAAYAAGIVVFFVVMYLLDRRNIRQKVFLATLMYLIDWFAHGITGVLRDILYHGILFASSVLEKTEMQYFLIFIVIENICLIVRFGFMILLLYMINRIYTCKEEEMSGKELALMLSVLLSTIAGYAVFTFFNETYLNDTQNYIQDVHSEYDWIKALYQLLAFAAIFSAVVFYHKIKESHRKEKENIVLHEQMENMKKHIREIETLYGDIRSLKHDMGNHVMILEGLCQKNQQQEAVRYLSALKEEFDEVTGEVKSGNPVTDVIIEEKRKEALQKGISFSCDFSYPRGARVDAFDVSIILSNGLDNALEGAVSCREPYIRVSSWQANNAYMIEMENSFTGTMRMDEETGMPVSSKADKEKHGYGLANIRRVAGKYFGDILVEQKEGRFYLRVMLMLE